MTAFPHKRSPRYSQRPTEGKTPPRIVGQRLFLLWGGVVSGWGSDTPTVCPPTHLCVPPGALGRVGLSPPTNLSSWALTSDIPTHQWPGEEKERKNRVGKRTVERLCSSLAQVHEGLVWRTCGRVVACSPPVKEIPWGFRGAAHG